MPARLPKWPPPETVRKMCVDTRVERWLFNDDVAELRCSWPTADVAGRLAEEAQERGDYATASVLRAYQHMLNPCYGTETMVRQLRSLRLAERQNIPKEIP
jgi:hypothetical protein